MPDRKPALALYQPDIPQNAGNLFRTAACLGVPVHLIEPCGFVLDDDPTVKMMGIGLATAIFVDATIIRMVLVPSTMSLVGDANWWLPRWLDRLLPHLDLEE